MNISEQETDEAIIRHYSGRGIYEEIIGEARKNAEDPKFLTTLDLSAFDEFHIGGRKATEHLMAQIPFTAGMNVLDIGSGIGGPARYVAESYHANVTGIDLTPEFCETATLLSQDLGLDKRTNFQAGSALAMPFKDQSFDIAYMIHVGMNILDKATVYSEAYRLLKPGGFFAIYDILVSPADGKMCFPVPWAESDKTSFLVSFDEITAILKETGFEIIHIDNRHDFAASALQQMMEKSTGKGKIDPNKLGNLITNFENGICWPWEFICLKM